VSEATLVNLEQQINALRKSTTDKSQRTEAAIHSGAIFTELQQSSLDWDALNSKVENLSKTLTGHGAAIDNEINSLKSDEVRWSATNEQARAQESAPELLDLTTKAVADIGAARKLAEERRSRVLAMQQSIATQSSLISTEIDHLNKAKAQSQRSLFEQDSLPLWKIQGVKQSDPSVGKVFSQSYDDGNRLKAFISAKRVPLVGILLLTLLAVVFFFRLKRSLGITTAESNLYNHTSLSQRPFSFALLIFLIAMLPLLYDAPNIAVSIVNLIGIVPVIRLLKPRLRKIFQQMVVALVIAVLVLAVIKVLQLSFWLKRDLFALFTVALVAVFAWLAHKARQERHGAKTVLLATSVGIVLLLIALLGNVFGYIGLSDLLTHATLIGAYRAVNLYTVFVVGVILLESVLQADGSAQRIASVPERHRVVQRLRLALGAVLILIWLHSALKLFGVREDFYAAIRDALKHQIHIGSATFDVSNLVAFVLTLLLGFLIASVIRAILGDAILPRLKLAHGLPNAIATITHYVLLVFIVLLALAAAGVELSKFTLLTGALGVGLGFGLQNIVNNFVSGLILLFERPVRIGDILEIGQVSGQVTKIGVRSTSLHAFDGSDLIIPNAKLISEQVVNWTLTGTRRQVVLNVPVAYGADPTQVRDLLSETAESHPQVLDFPKPVAFFLGFGDSALNFEVRFWAPRPDTVGDLKSDVALNIATALKDAGFTVPVPRRDLHITTTDQKEAKAIDATKKFDD
jgi:small-conductance mechanosensitive channel